MVEPNTKFSNSQLLSSKTGPGVGQNNFGRIYDQEAIFFSLLSQASPCRLENAFPRERNGGGDELLSEGKHLSERGPNSWRVLMAVWGCQWQRGLCRHTPAVPHPSTLGRIAVSALYSQKEFGNLLRESVDFKGVWSLGVSYQGGLATLGPDEANARTEEHPWKRLPTSCSPPVPLQVSV